MKKYYGAVILLFVINHLLSVDGYATENGYSPYIFRVKARCSNHKEKPGCSSESTGFISKEMNGIITALHGVVKRDSIDANNKDYTFLGLKIDKVDFDHDIALITSDDLKKKIKEKDGLNFLRSAYSNKDYDGIYTIGHPISLRKQLRSDSLNVRIPPLTELTDLLTPKTRSPMAQRKSPDINSNVISIEGTLMPGHSGAPILNKNNEVIGIASGGLRDGYAGICWAVPYNKMNLISKSLKEQELAALPIKEPALLSFTVFETSNGELLALQKQRTGQTMNWDAAQRYAERMNREALEGYSDWRVPSISELRLLAEIIKKYPYTDNVYWSSEEIFLNRNSFGFSSPDSGTARAFNPQSGKEAIRQKERSLAVWLVRNLM